MKSQLGEAERSNYQAAYCGLCHVLKSRYGRIATLFLNYDFAFLAMVLAGESQPAAPCLRRCVMNPARKRQTWLENPALTLAADESVILSYWKLRDSMTDSRFAGKLPAAAAALGLTVAYHRAKRRCPDFDGTVRQCLEELRALERENCQSLDRPADAFACILQAASGVHGRSGTHALGQMLYHIGRWIYLIDAWDDLEDDRKSGSYNPILACYGAEAQDAREALGQTLYASLGMADEAAEWLEFGPWAALVENIMVLGLPAVQEAVLSGEWKNAKKQRSKSDE